MLRTSCKLLSIALVSALVWVCLLNYQQVRSLKQQIAELETSVSSEVRKVADHSHVLVTNQSVQVTETVVVVTNVNVVVTNVMIKAENASPDPDVGVHTVPPVGEAVDQLVSTNVQQAMKGVRIEAEEARAAVKQLLKQQDKLLQEKLDYQKQVARLSASLARMQTEFDRITVEDESAEVGPSEQVATNSKRSVFDGRVVDYQVDLNMVVLDIGAKSGVKSGMQFSLVQEGRGIGRVRVMDVRSDLSGAVIEILKDTEEPIRGIRVIPYKDEKSDGS
jgi:hypothetical protein